MTRVVVTGSECTGKTTLARALAAHYETAWVPEYVRQFVEARGAAPVAGDVEVIARGQIAAEERIAADAGRLLILDTDLLSTLVYARHYYGVAPRWIVEAAAARRPDLYLLADVDVPWRPDGAQRDRGDQRERLQALFEAALERSGVMVVPVKGPLDCRLADSISAIDDTLSPPVR